MTYFWSVLWGVLTCAAVWITIRYYLPHLYKRTEKPSVEALACSEGSTTDDVSPAEETSVRGVYKNPVLNSKTGRILTIVLSSLFSLVCGYFAADAASSPISMVKMTLAAAVLACIMITDMECFIIPNLCSIILLAGRVLTIIPELIWARETLVSWLINSAIALVFGFMVLFLMSKITKGGIGMGDIKIFSALGFLCGIRALCFSLLFSFLLCAIASTALLAFKKKRMKDSLPLGPFIWLGYGVTVLFSMM